MSHSHTHPTHSTLRAAFVRMSKSYPDHPDPSPYLHEVLRNARILEVYHLGIELCDVHICSTMAIQDLILTRVSAILDEVEDELSASGGVGLEGEEAFGYATQEGQQQQQQQQTSDEENTDPGPESVSYTHL